LTSPPGAACGASPGRSAAGMAVCLCLGPAIRLAWARLPGLAR
jgi:hypothetical protein